MKVEERDWTVEEIAELPPGKLFVMQGLYSAEGEELLALCVSTTIGQSYTEVKRAQLTRTWVVKGDDGGLYPISKVDVCWPHLNRPLMLSENFWKVWEKGRSALSPEEQFALGTRDPRDQQETWRTHDVWELNHPKSK